MRESDDRGRHTHEPPRAGAAGERRARDRHARPAAAARVGAGRGPAQRVRRHRGAGARAAASATARTAASRAAPSPRRSPTAGCPPTGSPGWRSSRARRRGSPPGATRARARAQAGGQADPPRAAAHVRGARATAWTPPSGESSKLKSFSRSSANICSMTSHGSPYARFQRALATGNLNVVRAAAAELPRIGVAEAAAMLLVILRAEPRAVRARRRALARAAVPGAHARRPRGPQPRGGGARRAARAAGGGAAAARRGVRPRRAGAGGGRVPRGAS